MTYVLRIKAETTEEQMKVLEVFEKEGYLWRGLQLPTKFIPIHRYGKKNSKNWQPQKQNTKTNLLKN